MPTRAGGRLGVHDQLQWSQSETAEAAASRYQALFVDLLAWVKVQSTTADAPPPYPLIPPLPLPNGALSSPIIAAALLPPLLQRSPGPWLGHLGRGPAGTGRHGRRQGGERPSRPAPRSILLLACPCPL